MFLRLPNLGELDQQFHTVWLRLIGESYVLYTVLQLTITSCARVRLGTDLFNSQLKHNSHNITNLLFFYVNQLGTNFVSDLAGTRRW